VLAAGALVILAERLPAQEEASPWFIGIGAGMGVGTLKRDDGSPVINRFDQSSPAMNFLSIGFQLGFMIRLN